MEYGGVIIETFLTIEHAYSYGIELMLARKLNDEEKSHYQPDFRDRIKDCIRQKIAAATSMK